MQYTSHGSRRALRLHSQARPGAALVLPGLCLPASLRAADVCGGGGSAGRPSQLVQRVSPRGVRHVTTVASHLPGPGPVVGGRAPARRVRAGGPAARGRDAPRLPPRQERGRQQLSELGTPKGCAPSLVGGLPAGPGRPSRSTGPASCTRTAASRACCQCWKTTRSPSPPEWLPSSGARPTSCRQSGWRTSGTGPPGPPSLEDFRRLYELVRTLPRASRAPPSALTSRRVADPCCYRLPPCLRP